MTEKRKGELFSIAEAVMWGFFPIITVLSYHSLPALVSLAWSILFAALFFLGVVAVRNKWHEMLNPLLWKYVLIVTLILGVFLYVLYYIALEYTTPGNASLLALLQVFTSFLFFNVARKEKFSHSYIVGSILMVIGAVIVLLPNFTKLNLGDVLIVITMCVTPLGNFYSQKAMQVASSDTVMFLRSLLTVPFVFLLVFLMGKNATWTDIGIGLPFLLINGVLIFGVSKVFFLEAIHRLSVTKVIALESGGVLVTLAAAWAILGQTPTVWQLAAVVPLLLGVALLTDQLKIGARS